MQAGATDCFAQRISGYATIIRLSAVHLLLCLCPIPKQCIMWLRIEAAYSHFVFGDMSL